MITLKTDRLRVEISEPAETPNDHFRFDRAGFVSEIVLDGFMHFAASEPQNLRHPSSFGRGLCSEFRFDVSPDTPVGEYFPKIGVGLIRKEDEDPFTIHRVYKDCRLFPIEKELYDDSVKFHTSSIPCNGYAFENDKIIRIKDNHLEMQMKLTNTGEKPIEGEEFCHNFLSIDGMALGPDYHLNFMELPDQGTDLVRNKRNETSQATAEGHGFTFRGYSPSAFGFQVNLDNVKKAIPFKWKLINDGAKAYVLGKEMFMPSRINVWTCDHIVSSECFYKFQLNQGESAEWIRIWKFDRL